MLPIWRMIAVVRMGRRGREDGCGKGRRNGEGEAVQGRGVRAPLRGTVEWEDGGVGRDRGHGTGGGSGRLRQLLAAGSPPVPLSARAQAGSVGCLVAAGGT